MSEAYSPTRQQRTIIGHAGPAFVSACPGAGKTRVLIERARALLAERGGGRGIAFLSFTNAAVTELEGRLRESGSLPTPVFPHFTGTFDGFLWQFMLAPLGSPGCALAPRLIPDIDQRTVAPYSGARAVPLSCFDRRDGSLLSEKASGIGFTPNRRSLGGYETAARNARQRFRARGELDFEDVRSIVRDRLGDADFSVRLAGALAARFREVVVDEAQDCNPADLDIIQWLRRAGIVTKVICDPHQSIYEFRGGVTEQLFAFRDTFGATEQFPMTGNFRSTPNICKAIAMLRSRDARAVDEAIGRHRDDTTKVHVLAYPTQGGVPATIGVAFRELVSSHCLELVQCPVLAKTHASGARAIGQPADAGIADLSMRLAMAVTGFHFSLEIGNCKAAMERMHHVVLRLQDRLGAETYGQYVAAAGITTDQWRPQVLELLRTLRYDPSLFATPRDWHERAKQVLAPLLPPGEQTIAQRLRWNDRLATALAMAPATCPVVKTIHAAKGMEFPGVCVVMTQATSKGILDYLQTGEPGDRAEDAREIYVAASRAERLVVFAAPNSQAERLADHLGQLGSEVTLLDVSPGKVC